MLTRLNKYISESGISSRRKSEELIKDGRVSVDGKIIMDLAFKVDAEKNVVEVDGEKIAPRRHVYYLLNKPKGYITSTADEKNRNTVLELIKTKEKIFPIGRLDYNTTGVLLLTNDGDFANLLMHPKHRVPREYEVIIDKMLSEDDQKKFLKGVYIEGKRGRFTEIIFKAKKNRKKVNVVCEEGRNHFVKNMFRTLGYNVNGLNRISYAGVFVDIPIGSYRQLSKDEIEKIKEVYA